MRVAQDARASTIQESSIKIDNRLLDSCLKDVAILKQELEQDLSDKTMPSSLKPSSTSMAGSSTMTNQTDDLFTLVAAMTIGKGLGSRLAAAKSDSNN